MLPTDFAQPDLSPRAGGILPDHLSLVGVPLEWGASTSGTLMGPAALRVAGLARTLAELGFEIADHGDLVAPLPVAKAAEGTALARSRHTGEVAAWTRLIHDRAYALARTETRPIFLGGDHSLSMGSISGIARHCAEIGQELVVLWIDAHGDFNTPTTSPSGNLHGMSLAFLTGDPDLAPLLGMDLPAVLKPGNIHLVGLRAIDREERARLAHHGLDCVDMREIDEVGMPAILRRLLAGVEGRNVHLHVSLDADALDPGLAPGVGTAVPGGLTYREAHLMMEMLHDSGLVASLDVVELNPFLDERGRSAILLVDLIASLFGRVTLHRDLAGLPAR